MRKVFLPLLVIPLLLGAAPARADDASVAQAKQSFTQGAQAYREARYKDAIDLFLRANQLDPHPELIFNVGQAYEKLGDVPAALRSYREYLRLSPGVADRATVEASIKNLEARLRERGVQQVSIFSTPSGATLLLDQKVAGQTPWTGEIAPGRHLAVLRSQGFPDTAKEFVLLSDHAMDLDIALAAGAQPATPAAAQPDPKGPPPAPPAAPPKKRGVAPWTIATLTVGLAGLAGALGAEIARESAESAAKSDLTQVGFKNSYDAMVTRQTAARVLVGVGAGLTAVGTVLLVVDLRSGSSAPPRAGLGCVDGACGAFVSGRF
jgi:tetratricopeptide (TPR) repeat protein